MRGPRFEDWLSTTDPRSKMAKTDQSFDASGVSVAKMSPEEIDAALEAIGKEATATEPKTDSPEDAEHTSSDPQQISDASDAPSATAAPPPEAPAPAADAPVDGGKPDSLAADTEAALDNIDKDLAELEALLAQTADDNISVPESILCAPPPVPEAEPSETPTPQEATAGEAAPQDSAPDDDQNREGDISEMDISASDAAETSSLDEQPAGGESSADSGEAESDADTDRKPAEESRDAVNPAAEAAAQPSAQKPPEELAETLVSILLAPLMMIDRPFAGLSLRTKTAIGVAGVATLVVATFALIIGRMK